MIYIFYLKTSLSKVKYNKLITKDKRRYSMNYIDGLIIVFVGYSCFQGYRRGFIKTLFDTLGVIIAFFLSKGFYYLTENFLLNNTKLFVKVHDFFESKLSEKLMEYSQYR